MFCFAISADRNLNASSIRDEYTRIPPVCQPASPPARRYMHKRSAHAQSMAMRPSIAWSRAKFNRIQMANKSGPPPFIMQSIECAIVGCDKVDGRARRVSYELRESMDAKTLPHSIAMVASMVSSRQLPSHSPYAGQINGMARHASASATLINGSGTQNALLGIRSTGSIFTCTLCTYILFSPVRKPPQYPLSWIKNSQR